MGVIDRDSYNRHRQRNHDYWDHECRNILSVLKAYWFQDPNEIAVMEV
jgi:hypothetical protein